MKLLSIIIPTYNRPELLQKALTSIKTVNENKIEVIICDDFSTEENYKRNLEVLRQFENKKIQISYLVNYKNKGVSGARNCGIYEADGEWVLFLDDDDEFTDGYIDYLISMITNNRNIDFFWSDIYIKDSRINEKLIKKRFFINNESELYNRVLTIGLSYGVCIRKQCLLMCNGFDESFLVGEDTELILNLITKECSFQHIPYYGVIKNETNHMMLSKDLKKYACNHVIKQILLKYFDFFEKDISLYCSFIKRGNHIYLSENKNIENFFFNLLFILKHKKKYSVAKEVKWRL